MFRIRQYVSGDFCLSCLGCCRYNCNPSIWVPHLLEEEKKALNLQKIKPILYHQSYICCFLNPANNLCQIYTKRPLECRLYPFLLNYCDNKIYLSLALNCPNRLIRTDTKEFKIYFNYLIRYLQKPSILKILSKNRQIFTSYPVGEVLNLAELKI